jgi:hypothetical protein
VTARAAPRAAASTFRYVQDDRTQEDRMTTQPEACDLLIEAGFVVPVEPQGVVLENHAVAIRDGVILEVAPIHEARVRYAARETVSRPDAALIPGLVNAHTHNPMTLLRGVADDLPLMEWLQGHIWPIEGAVIGPEFVADGIALAIAEMLRAVLRAPTRTTSSPTCRPRSTSSTASVPAWGSRSSISRLRGRNRPMNTSIAPPKCTTSGATIRSSPLPSRRTRRTP